MKPMRFGPGRLAVLLASWLAFVLAAGLPALAAEETQEPPEVRLEAEFGPTAPEAVVRQFQVEAGRRLPGWMGGRPEAGAEAEGWAVLLEETPRGVVVRMELPPGATADAAPVAEAFRQPMELLLREVGASYSTRLDVQVPSVPSPGLPGGPWLPAAGAVAVVGAVALIVLRFRRARPAGTPRLWGLPVIGVLPESLLRLGRLYHLQAKPCQAMTWFFLQRAGGQREFVLVGPTPEAAAIVAVGIAANLSRQGQSVLLVDVAGPGEVFPGVLARFGPEDAEAVAGSTAASGLPDVDHMTLGEVPLRAGALPADVLDRYRVVLHVLPPGQRPAGMGVLEIVHRATLRAAVPLWFSRRTLGWVVLGESVPVRVSDAYYTRYYYARIQEPGVPSHALA